MVGKMTKTRRIQVDEISSLDFGIGRPASSVDCTSRGGLATFSATRILLYLEATSDLYSYNHYAQTSFFNPG